MSIQVLGDSNSVEGRSVRASESKCNAINAGHDEG